jgi:hypothetical protein
MKTLKQIEETTGISTANLRQRIARGTLKTLKKIGNTWLISNRVALRLVKQKKTKRGNV